jgi:hypothetical protein
MDSFALRRCLLLSVFVLVAWFDSSGLWAVTLHVAPDGNDAHTGRLARPNDSNTDGPLASLSAARDAIRRLKAQGKLKPNEPVEVLVADGEYALGETLVFEPQDGGTAEAPVIYRAADGARPVFSGGRKIKGFENAGNGP